MIPNKDLEKSLTAMWGFCFSENIDILFQSQNIHHKFKSMKKAFTFLLIIGALMSCQKEDPPQHTPSPVVTEYSMSWDIHGGSGQVQSFIYVNSQEVTSEPVMVQTGDSIKATIKKVGLSGQMGQAGITLYLDGVQKLQDIRTIENGTQFEILLIPE